MRMNNPNLKLFNKLLPKPLQVKKARLDMASLSRNKLVATDQTRLPIRRLPGSELIYMADHCLQVVLDHSDEARAIFSQVVHAWELPGCYSQLFLFTKRYRNQIKHYNEVAMNYDARSKDLSPPVSLAEFIGIGNTREYTENDDFHRLENCTSKLILVGFNRKVDLDNHQPKVILQEAPLLIVVIALRSIIAYLNIDLAQYDRLRRGEDSHIHHFGPDSTKLTTRLERAERTKILQYLKREGIDLRHDKKRLKDANQWYGCRVDPGSIEIYLDELDKEAQKIDTRNFTPNDSKKFEAKYYPSRSNIETAIAPYDEATGYPRKWRK